MRFPCVVDKRFCTTPIHLEFESEELDNYGDPKALVAVDAKCNYQDSSKMIMTAEKEYVQLSGVALFPGDIAPDLPTIGKGTATIFSEQRSILRGTKARNPDGTVNHCRVELI